MACLVYAAISGARTTTPPSPGNGEHRCPSSGGNGCGSIKMNATLCGTFLYGMMTCMATQRARPVMTQRGRQRRTWFRGYADCSRSRQRPSIPISPRVIDVRAWTVRLHCCFPVSPFRSRAHASLRTHANLLAPPAAPRRITHLLRAHAQTSFIAHTARV